MVDEKSITEILVFTVDTQEYEIKTSSLDGIQYIVVPVVMMVEGVHSGSGGPLLHLAEELGKYPQSWNGIPVTIYHPDNGNGRNISANSPEVLEQWSVGRVFNTYMDGTKLKAEVWIDINKIENISQEALSYIKEGRHLEVSVGVFTDEDPTSGTYVNTNGENEEYVAIARNLRPDHLALLPGEAGACGWSDGCGIRANSGNQKVKDEVMEQSNEKEKDVKEVVVNEEVEVSENTKTEVKPTVKHSDIILTMKKQAMTDFLATIVDNKQGYLELLQKLQEKLDALDTDSTYHYVEELYDGNFVYRMRNHRDRISQLYRQTYTLDSNEAVEFVGEREQVRRNVDYVQVNKMKRTKFNTNNEELEIMDKPCCKEKVDALIANKQTLYTEADREWLSDLGTENLEKMVPVEVEPVDNTIQVNMEEYVEKATLKTYEDVVALAPAGVKEQLELGQELYVNHRAELVANILANAEKDVWTEDELNGFETNMLSKLSKQFKNPEVYVGQGQTKEVIANTKTIEEKLLPNGVIVKNN